jgi:predicted nuclease of predicted toxin-antitoxin system
MKFLADMGISPHVVEELRQKGHNATHLLDEGLYRMTDGDILEKARQEKCVLLTHDLDFGELLAASGGNLPSVIIFRLKDMRASNGYSHNPQWIIKTRPIGRVFVYNRLARLKT